VASTLPPLTFDKHKGQAGRIGVLGGSEMYTGAPYFAAATALRMGADLATVFCAPDAAMPIKSYNPEVMVNPLPRNTFSRNDASAYDEMASEIQGWFPKLSVLVIGPGMGRSTAIQEVAKRVIAAARKANLPLVIDGDGLFLVSQAPALIEGYKRVILTPNAMEFRRLWEAIEKDAPPPLDFDLSALNIDMKTPPKDDTLKRFGLFAHPHDAAAAMEREPSVRLARRLGGVTILSKGQIDLVTDGNTLMSVAHRGSPRRAGGQGDVLAGAIATFYSWALSAAGKDHSEDSSTLAAFAGAYFTRRCAESAFLEHGRSMGALHLLSKVPELVREVESWEGAPARSPL